MLRKQTTVRIENVKNDIFENFKNSKITQKDPKINKSKN